MLSRALSTHPAYVVLEGVVPYPSKLTQLYREKEYWQGETIADMFFEAVDTYRGSVAVIDDGASYTYGELGTRALSLAHGFLESGIQRSDRVVVQLPNIVEFLDVILALFEIGALPVFALPAHRRSEIKYFCEFSGAVAFVTIDSYEGFSHVELAHEMLEEVACIKRMFIVDRRSGGKGFSTTYLDPLNHEFRCSPSDIAFLQLSGGTTGKPKLIPRTHDDYLYSIRESAKICGLTQESTHLVVLPAAHNYTMSSPGILGCIYAGAKMVFAANGSPDLVFPLIEEHQVTSVSLVPPIALLWLNSSLKPQFDLSSLQVVQVGGAKLSKQAAERVGPELGCILQQVFGMAEGLVNYTRLDDQEDMIIKTQGRRISEDDEVLVVDECDCPVPRGTPGDLLTRGPYTIRGYYKAPESNSLNFTADGFYRTGDIVIQDDQNYLTVVGRRKDQINRGGEKISPEEVENLLLSHESIHDASIIGVPDEILGERIKAYVIPRTGVSEGALSSFKLKKFLRQKAIAEFKVPDEFEIVDRFPETFVGKTSKKAQRL